VEKILAIARRHGLALVEDAAQAHGARLGDRLVGTFGDAAAFSFYPTKNLGCPGDGGAVVTMRADVAERVGLLRCYGWDEQQVSRICGLNSRLDEIHAAMLRVLLPALDNSNAERRAVAAGYLRELAGLPMGLPVDCPGAVYHQFVVEVANREPFRQWLAAGGIGTGVHYPMGLHDMPAFPRADLPVTDALTASIVSLPIQPEVAAGERPRILARIRGWQWQ
jgi:dTDP-4-amino-4,6-dideoxygalactose transaminase